MSGGRRVSIVVDSKGVNKVANELNKLNGIGNRVVTGLKKIPTAIGNIGKKLWSMKGRIALGAAAMAGAILVPFAKLQTSLARVQIALGDFAGVSNKQLKDLADQLGRDTLYSASDAAEGMLYLAKSGMDVNEILAATPGVLNAAIVEGLDLATAADVITDALVTMNLAADQAGRVADVLALGSNLAKTNIPEMGSAIGKVGTIARLSGIDLENLVGMLDAVAGYGIRGEEAGTHLRTAMMTFQNIGDGSITGNAKKAFKDLGIDVDKIAKGIKDKSIGFTDFAKMVFESGASAGQFSQIFEKRTAASIIAIGEAASGSNPELANFVAQLYEAAGYSEKAAEILEGTLTGQFKQIMSSLQTMTNAIAETFAPALMDFMENDMRPWINEITQLWDEGGDTWQEKLSTVWSEKLKPEFEAGLESLVEVMAAAIPKLTDLAITIGEEIVPAVVKGIGRGLINMGKHTLEEYRAMFDFTPTMDQIRATKFGGDLLPDQISLEDPAALPTFGTLGSDLSSGPFSSAPTNGLSFTGVEDKMLEALQNIDDNTANPPETDDEGGGSAGWLSDLLNGDIGKAIGSMFLDPMSQVLLSSVTDPITASLEKTLGPTSTEIGHLADAFFGAFDVPLSALDSGIRWLTDFFGGNDFDDGRFTYAGAYASTGTSYSSSSAIHTGDIHVSGVENGEEAADAVVKRMAQQGEVSSRQTSLGLRKGMVSREASEY